MWIVLKKARIKKTCISRSKNCRKTNPEIILNFEKNKTNISSKTTKQFTVVVDCWKRIRD